MSQNQNRLLSPEETKYLRSRLGAEVQRSEDACFMYQEQGDTENFRATLLHKEFVEKLQAKFPTE